MDGEFWKLDGRRVKDRSHSFIIHPSTQVVVVVVAAAAAAAAVQSTTT